MKSIILGALYSLSVIGQQHFDNSDAYSNEIADNAGFLTLESMLLEYERAEYNDVRAQYEELLALYNEALVAAGRSDEIVIPNGQPPYDLDVVVHNAYEELQSNGAFDEMTQAYEEAYINAYNHAYETYDDEETRNVFLDAYTAAFDKNAAETYNSAYNEAYERYSKENNPDDEQNKNFLSRMWSTFF